jgi:hypothetical protein
MATKGMHLANNKKAVKNKPKLPKRVAISARVGLYIAQLDGRKSR